MTVLYLDVGNSRVKWLSVDADGTSSSMSAAIHGGVVAEKIAAVVGECAPKRVVAVDVTGTLPQGLPDGLPFRLFTATEEVAGLVNGYVRPAQLGADRWAAIVGARQDDAVLVIDAGTAITADLVDGSGHHLGGWIAPGLTLAASALMSSTRGIRVDEEADTGAMNPGTDTAHAVAGGTLLALSGFATQAVATAADILRTQPRIVVTGGDASIVAMTLQGATVVEDLVLRGLMRWDGGQQ